MPTTTYSLEEKASISLNAAARREEPSAAAPMAIRAVTRTFEAEALVPRQLVPVIVETKGVAPPEIAETAEQLADEFFSAWLPPQTALSLAALPHVRRIQTKRRKTPTLDHVARNIGLAKSADVPRIVEETGRGVLVFDAAISISVSSDTDDTSCPSTVATSHPRSRSRTSPRTPKFSSSFARRAHPT